MRTNRSRTYAPRGAAGMLAWAAVALACAAGTLAGPADASRGVTAVREYGALTLENNRGATVDERGYGWGSFSCNVYIQLTLNGTLVTARYSAYPHSGGSIIGTATAHIHRATTKEAEFSGTITLTSGSGSPPNASRGAL